MPAVDSNRVIRKTDTESTLTYSVILYFPSSFAEERVISIFHETFRFCGLNNCVEQDLISADAMISQKCGDKCVLEPNAKNRWKVEHILKTKVGWTPECAKNAVLADCQYCNIQNDVARFFSSDLAWINFNLDGDLNEYNTSLITNMKEKDGNGEINFQIYILEDESKTKSYVENRIKKAFRSQNNNFFRDLIIHVDEEPDCALQGYCQVYLYQRKDDRIESQWQASEHVSSEIPWNYQNIDSVNCKGKKK